MFLPMNDHSCSALVTSTSDHDDIPRIKLDEINNFSLLEIVLDGVVDVDGRVGVADGASVVSDDVWDTLGTKLYPSDFEELVSGFFGGDAVNDEATFDVVEEAEVLAGLFDRDNVHVPSGIGSIRAHLAIDFDEPLHNDSGYFTSIEGILQPVSEEDNEGEGFAKFVGTR